MEVKSHIYLILLENQENYNKKIPPFAFDKVNNVNIPVNINVSMSIIDIMKIEEMDHVYNLKFRLVLEWYLFMEFIHLNIKRGVRNSDFVCLCVWQNCLLKHLNQ